MTEDQSLAGITLREFVKEMVVFVLLIILLFELVIHPINDKI